MKREDVNKETLELVFEIGEVIASGGTKAKLRIKKTTRDAVIIHPVGAKTPRKLQMEYLQAIHRSFEAINPKSVNKSIQTVFRKHGIADDTWRENYMYGLVREFRNRTIGVFTLPDEVALGSVFFEGARKTISVNAYERSQVARSLCIAKWGLACSVCEMTFTTTYGEIGDGYIHVHHLTPLSHVGKTYEIDPALDLRPVCPNCHAMLHQPTGVLSIEELKAIWRAKHEI